MTKTLTKVNQYGRLDAALKYSKSFTANLKKIAIEDGTIKSDGNERLNTVLEYCKMDIPEVKEQGKQCSKCGEWKEWKEFSLNRNSRDGRQTHCKKCQSKFRKKNDEKLREIVKKFLALAAVEKWLQFVDTI